VGVEEVDEVQAKPRRPTMGDAAASLWYDYSFGITSTVFLALVVIVAPAGFGWALRAYDFTIRWIVIVGAIALIFGVIISMVWLWACVIDRWNGMLSDWNRNNRR
jgi:hypothetical protein